MEIHSGSRTLEAPRGNSYAPARGLLVMMLIEILANDSPIKINTTDGMIHVYVLRLLKNCKVYILEDFRPLRAWCDLTVCYVNVVFFPGVQRGCRSQYDRRRVTTLPRGNQSAKCDVVVEARQVLARRILRASERGIKKTSKISPASVADVDDDFHKFSA